MRTKKELLSLINNQKTKEELISKSFSIITREDIPPYGSTLEEVKQGPFSFRNYVGEVIIL